jgi:hypothetical protein
MGNVRLAVGEGSVSICSVMAISEFERGFQGGAIFLFFPSLIVVTSLHRFARRLVDRPHDIS